MRVEQLFENQGIKANVASADESARVITRGRASSKFAAFV